MRFSIILPVYNVERFLHDCIDSLLNQHNMTIGQDYELIFVNDGSTDNSLELIEKLGKDLKGKGVLIINQNNKGVSEARNEGLRHAKGDFVWFVDPDDMIASQSLEWADIELKNNPELKVIRYYCRKVPENVNPKELLAKQYTLELPQAPTAISLIVNRQHLMDNDIRFNTEMAYGEDTLWVFEVNFLAEDNAVGDGGKVNYFYRIRQGSAMTTRNAKTKRKHLSSMLTMLGAYETLLKEKGDLLSHAQKYHLQKRVDWSVQNVLFDALFLLPKDERQDLYQEVAHRQKSLNWKRLSLGYGINNLLVNLIGLPLKYKLYYTLMGYLSGIIKRR